MQIRKKKKNNNNNNADRRCEQVRQEGDCDEVTMTYESFSSHPRHRSGPTSPRCRLSSENTEAHCLMGFHGPTKHVKADSDTSFFNLKNFYMFDLKIQLISS